jgi:DNA (cytosine-5)-methyltransferase 1
MEMKYAFLDLFCGCGGTTSGIENIPGAFVFGCVNHDKNAILSHQSNHPGALHYTEDIRTISINKILEKVKEVRSQYPGIKICLWASLECTNHSNAKGGMSREADSRTLAEHLFRYFIMDFDLIFIENVKEFKDWGPLIHKHIAGVPQYEKNTDKPIMIPDKRYKGVDYKNWIKNVCEAGYNYEDTIINCADIGCPTTRKRLFIQFAKPSCTISWPEKTHSKNGENGLKEWLPVAPLLQLQEHGDSIFDRAKALAPNTYKRIFKGIKKFGIAKPFISKYYGNGDNVCEISQPCPTLTTKDRCYLTKTFLIGEYGNSTSSDISKPAPTLTTIPKEKVVTSHFLMDHQFSNEGNSINEPCPTLIARQDKKPKYLVSAEFLKTNEKPIDCDYIICVSDKKNNSTIQEGDCEDVILLKMFMQEHRICDIKMRPLQITEMLKIMTFPEEYILKGTKTEQKKYIGNAVPPLAAEKIVQKSMMMNF